MVKSYGFYNSPLDLRRDIAEGQGYAAGPGL